MPELSKAEVQRRKEQSERDKKMAHQQKAKANKKKNGGQKLYEHKLKVREHIIAGSSQNDYARKLAMLMSMPVKAFRLPSEDRVNSSIAHIKSALTYSSAPLVGPSSFGGEAGDQVVAFYGQPGRAYVHWSNNAASALYRPVFNEYLNGVASSGGIQQSFDWFPVQGTTNMTGSVFLAESQFWPCGGASIDVSGTTKPHGDFLPAGINAGISYLFMNKGDILTCNIFATGATMSGTAMFTIMEMTDRGGEPQATNLPNNGVFGLSLTGTSSSASTGYTIVNDGYYTVQYGGLQTTGGVATLRVNFTLDVTAGNKWFHVSMRDFLGNTFNKNGLGSVLGSNARVNGASLLMTNTTAGLYKGGSVLASRVIASVPFFSLTKRMVAENAEPYQDGAERGVYTFIEPTDARSVYWEHSVANCLQFNLEDNDRYNAIVISQPIAAGVMSPQTFVMTVEMAIEYTTDCPLMSREPYLGEATVESLARARAIINSVPQWFFENPMHMSDIYNFVKSGYRKAMNNSDKISSAASIFSPTVGAASKTMFDMMKSLGL